MDQGPSNYVDVDKISYWRAMDHNDINVVAHKSLTCKTFFYIAALATRS